MSTSSVVPLHTQHTCSTLTGSCVRGSNTCTRPSLSPANTTCSSCSTQHSSTQHSSTHIDNNMAATHPPSQQHATVTKALNKAQHRTACRCMRCNFLFVLQCSHLPPPPPPHPHPHPHQSKVCSPAHLLLPLLLPLPIPPQPFPPPNPRSPPKSAVKSN